VLQTVRPDITFLKMRLRQAVLVVIVVAAVAAWPAGTLGQPSRRAARERTNVTITGHGARVLTIRLVRSTPLVVTAFHNGTSNFIVDLVGGGQRENLFNEIGRYNGQTALSDVHAGRYRVAVQADGSWTIAFAQPTPPRSARLIPGTISGRGARVVAIRSTRSMEPIVTATHHGHSNFIVDLIGYGTTTGEVNVFNEIGNYQGQMLLDRIPKGPYLLHVQADGPWTLRFVP
jgi:hypothetical protein